MITISELAKNLGMTLRTIRYYEERGLISSLEGERIGNMRVYPRETVSLLQRIAILKEAGLHLDEINSILHVLGDGETKDKKLTVFLRETLTDARKKIQKKRRLLTEIEKNLSTVLEKTAQCDRCETRNSEKDCSGCENLSVLRQFENTSSK
jgi:DNA-binding transcriptional MerR regulator